MWIGGGAALAGRHPDYLLVDDRGRWPVDRGPTLDHSGLYLNPDAYRFKAWLSLHNGM